MIGLVNAVGLGSSVRAAGAARRDHDHDSRFGIQVPIPLAQREEEASRGGAVQALEREGAESGPLDRESRRAGSTVPREPPSSRLDSPRTLVDRLHEKEEGARPPPGPDAARDEDRGARLDVTA